MLPLRQTAFSAWRRDRRSIVEFDDEYPGSQVVTLSRGPGRSTAVDLCQLCGYEVEENRIHDEAILNTCGFQVLLLGGHQRVTSRCNDPITRLGMATNAGDPVMIMDA